MKPGFKIRDIIIDPPLILAPMSGLTSSAFRRLIKRLNPGAVGMVMSEFLSVEGMTRNGVRTLEMMRFREEERPITIQIFGKDPARMRDAALMVEDTGADIIDVNCGCPAPKVVRKGGGCILMRQPEELRIILREIRNAIKIPLTVKMRAGWDSSRINALEIARIAEGEGAECVTVHGRTRAEMYRGEADWDLVGEIAEELSIPVCGSGDIHDLESAEARFKGRIAGLYIGRAALSNPLVFREIVEGQKQNLRLDEARVISVLSDYLELLQEDLPEKAVLGRLKQLISRLVPRSWKWKNTALRGARLRDVSAVLQSVVIGHPQGTGICSDYAAD